MNDDKEFEDANAEEEGREKGEQAEESQKGAISADLIRGHINTIILRTLDERDKYGYEIMNEIEEKSHGQYSLKQPTLYSALKRLESQGYIKAYWKTDEVSSGGRRKYFTLTELGREYAEKNQSEWEYSRTVIDSLISDRSFDFSQPAPTHVDFNLLKKSVSRVYTGGSGEKDEEDIEDRIQRLSAGASPSPADPQSEYAKQYAQIESAPVRAEYSGNAVHDLFVEKREEIIEDGEKKREEQAAKAEEKTAETTAADRDKTSQSKESAEQAQPAQNTYVQTEQPAGQNVNNGYVNPAAQNTYVQTEAQPAGQNVNNGYVNPAAQPAQNTYVQTETQLAGQNINNGYPPYPSATPYAGHQGAPQYPQPPYFPEGYPQAYAPYGQDYYNRPYPQAYDPYGRPYAPYPPQEAASQQYAAQQQQSAESETREQIKRELFAAKSVPEQPSDTRSAEEKRKAHENFLKLIAEQDGKNTVPNSDEIDTDKLIYTNKPETERDYKKLVSNIFNKAIKSPEPVYKASDEPQVQQPVQQAQETTEVRYEQPQPAPQPRYDYSDPAYEKARTDGLKINTSSSSGVRMRGARDTSFNKGAALFASAVIVGVILLIEFAVCMALMKPLGVGIMYPITLLIIAVVLVATFGIMYACGYGKSSIRPATHGYISLCAVLTVIAILVVCLISFLLEINLQSSTDIAVKLVIPAVTALNITVFGVSYFFISK